MLISGIENLYHLMRESKTSISLKITRYCLFMFLVNAPTKKVKCYYSCCLKFWTKVLFQQLWTIQVLMRNFAGCSRFLFLNYKAFIARTHMHACTHARTHLHTHTKKKKKKNSQKYPLLRTQ